MKCPSARHCTEICLKKNQATYFLMPVFIYVENTRRLLHLLVLRYYDFRARNNHCGTIAHKISTSATFLLRCMKKALSCEIQ